ncbi:MAG: A/G-specific adenine glycosylase [Synergistaceae bacterium]|nr:A/G-specific adenine glycosylase [Synergistaceae bacterium]
METEGRELPPEEARRLAELLVAWSRANARDLPWRRRYDPYEVLVSEIMLQQTRAATVAPYFERWVARWPDLRSLAEADEAEALKLWEGLGYYSRCRDLLKAARALVAAGHAEPPASVEELRACPGIGEYTAGAVAAFGHDLPVPAIDGNAERVLSRLLGIEERLGSAALRRAAARAVTRMLVHASARELDQAIMDLGATICAPRAPRCAGCPWEAHCCARRGGRQGELPLPRARAAISKEAAWGLLILHPLGILLRRRPDGGLWASRWEVPWIARSSEDPWEDIVPWIASSGMPLRLRRDGLSELGTVDFSFTIHRVRARALRCDAQDALVPAGAQEAPSSPPADAQDALVSAEAQEALASSGTQADGPWRLFVEEELDGLALPAPSRKLLAMMKG